MKIGVLTLPLQTNYGGILQAYALQTTLERMGHEVILLNESRIQKLKPSRAPFTYTKRLLKKYLLNQKCRIFEEQYQNKIYPIISQHLQKFINKYIHCIYLQDLCTLHSNEFDAIIVGSDQIWRPKYYPKIENAFLDFTKKWNIKRIAYAASFGTDKWEYTSTQTNKCKKLIQKFNAISVRESSAVDLCKRYFNTKALHVLDPTMLLNKEDYIKLFEAVQTPQSPGNLLVYILDETPDKTSLINNIAQKKGLTPFRVNSQIGNPNAPLKKRIQPSVEQWIRGFYDAEFVITDSFHACVFSILFGKPFIVYGNEGRGLTRFESLLSTFEFKNSITTDIDKVYINNIDPDLINKLLLEMRNHSISFLQSVL